MYCKKCGTELRENDTFCYYCGNRIGAGTDVAMDAADVV